MRTILELVLVVLVVIQLCGMTWVLVWCREDLGSDSPVWWRLVAAFFWPIVAFVKWIGFAGPQ